MAKPRAQKLKVFQAQFGFYDTVVAAPSQAAALRAWGIHQNLFASGEASVATNEAAVKAALDHPEIPLRRAVGSSDPFELEPKGLPTVADAPAGPATPRERVRAPKNIRAKAPADRSELDAAEKALSQLDEQRKQEEAELGREEEALEEKKAAAQSAYVAARKTATAAVVKAREAYRRAGGTG